MKNTENESSYVGLSKKNSVVFHAAAPIDNVSHITAKIYNRRVSLQKRHESGSEERLL